MGISAKYAAKTCRVRFILSPAGLHNRSAAKAPILHQALTDLFDASYIHPALQQVDLADPRLSPGLMPDDLIDRLPPVYMCLCEHDMFLAEGMRFKERLRMRDKMINVRVVAGEKHAWDKRPAISFKRSIRAEYDEAIKMLEACVIGRRL